MSAMETSPRQKDNNNNNQSPSLLPSPNSSSGSSSGSSSTTTSNTNTNIILNQQAPAAAAPTPTPPSSLPSPKPITRSESANPYPTTFVQADTASFKQVVQMLTGSPRPTASATAASAQPDPSPKNHHHHHHHHHIPPIKSIPKKTQSSSSGFKLYERRNSLKNLKINPLNPIFAPPSSSFSPRKPEILSPSILDFPALVLSPVTPLIPDPFDRSGLASFTNSYSPSPMSNKSSSGMNCDSLNTEAEEKAIKEKGFYLHPSPATTPREAEPRLLPLFPVTSPRVSGSAANSSS